MNIEYYVAFQKFLNSMLSVQTSDLSGTQEAFEEIARFLNTAKITVTFYENISKETENRGHEYLLFKSEKNTGAKTFSRRFISEIFSVAVYEFTQSENAPEWTAEEIEQLELISKITFNFNSRLRLRDIADRLTYFDDDGYRNMRFYINEITGLIQNGKIYGKTAVWFNLKNFSLVNQQIGRMNGNIVMRKYFEMFENLIGDKGFVCRMGGDNFLIISESEMTGQIIELLKGVPVHYTPEPNDTVNLSSTASIFEIKENMEIENFNQVIDALMSATTVAKSGTAGRIVFYNESMGQNKEKIMKIQNIFPTAIEKEEFLVYYQPKIDLDGKCIAGAEALCRWFHDGKLISPADFIPALESGMEICTLDFYMLDHVCSDIRRWLDAGKKVVRVSVNLSRKHIMDNELLDRIISVIDSHGVPHRYIEIELTETTTDVEFTDLKRIVSGLQEAGIYASVDDFGMGYSSLNLIKEIPWNVLKVDKNFIPLDESDNDRTSVMFKYVIAMAREMGLECIAEGVETSSQVELLKANNCDLAQGFFFDRPLPVSEFEQRLDKEYYN